MLTQLNGNREQRESPGRGPSQPGGDEFAPLLAGATGTGCWALLGVVRLPAPCSETPVLKAQTLSQPGLEMNLPSLSLRLRVVVGACALLLELRRVALHGSCC